MDVPAGSLPENAHQHAPDAHVFERMHRIYISQQPAQVIRRRANLPSALKRFEHIGLEFQVRRQTGYHVSGPLLRGGRNGLLLLFPRAVLLDDVAESVGIWVACSSSQRTSSSVMGESRHTNGPLPRRVQVSADTRPRLPSSAAPGRLREELPALRPRPALSGTALC